MDLYVVSSPASMQDFESVPKLPPAQYDPALRIKDGETKDLVRELEGRVHVSSQSSPSLAIDEYLAEANSELASELSVEGHDGVTYQLKLQKFASRPIGPYWAPIGGALVYLHPMFVAEQPALPRLAYEVPMGATDDEDQEPGLPLRTRQLYAPIIAAKITAGG